MKIIRRTINHEYDERSFQDILYYVGNTSQCRDMTRGSAAQNPLHDVKPQSYLVLVSMSDGQDSGDCEIFFKIKGRSLSPISPLSCARMFMIHPTPHS